MKKSKEIDAYISKYDGIAKQRLEEMREIMHECASEAEEKLSYGMPTLDYYGNLVHYAPAKSHLGFYPSPSGIVAFESELENYTYSKGAIQFPFEKKLPKALIKKITKFRLQENEEKASFKMLSAPAQRAIAAKGIKTLKELATVTQEDFLSWHGVGPSALPKVLEAFSKKKLKFEK